MKTKNNLSMMRAALILFLAATSSFAQKAEQPDNVYNLSARINDIILTEAGTLVVATNDGLVGIKPESNELVFNFTDYKRVKPEELFFVPHAPYVMVDQSGWAAISTKKAVIDYLSGKTLFSSEKNGWRAVYSCDVMMPQNKLVVSGQRTGKEQNMAAVAVYDLDTGNQESFFQLKGNRVVSGRPLMLKNSLIVPTSRELVNIDLASGEITWTNKVGGVKWMVADQSENEIYTFEGMNNGDTKIYKISKSGTVLWDKERRVKGGVSNFEILPNGLAVVSDVDNSGKSGLGKLASGRSESKIAFLSASTGEDLWDKAPKTKGFVQHFYIMDDGILFGIYQGGINKISFDGKTLFKKPLNTGEDILTMAETPQGLIYITGGDANIVNLETGDQVWEKPLKYRKAKNVSSTFDEGNNRFLISVDGELHAVDANTGESSLLAMSKFQGTESPSGIEIRDNGILLTSDQNLKLIDWEGNEVFHQYYRAPGKSAFGIILMATTTIAATTIAASSYSAEHTYRNQLRQYNKADMYGDLGDSMVAVAGASMAEMAKKFKATSATKDDRFILTKLDEGVGLVKVNKDSGEVTKEIILKDKQPHYEVDERGGILYYKANNNTIYLYDLKK